MTNQTFYQLVTGVWVAIICLAYCIGEYQGHQLRKQKLDWLKLRDFQGFNRVRRLK